MRAREVELRGKAEFMQWLRRSKSRRSYNYGLLMVPEGLILRTDLPSGRSLNDRCWPNEFVPIQLPTIAEAPRWWDELWQEEVFNCWFGRGVDEAVVCAAKPRIWRPQNSLHAALCERNFQSIWDEDLEALCGRQVATAMWNEVRLVGFSVRRVSPFAVVPTHPEEDDVRRRS